MEYQFSYKLLTNVLHAILPFYHVPRRGGHRGEASEQLRSVPPSITKAGISSEAAPYKTYLPSGCKWDFNANTDVIIRAFHSVKYFAGGHGDRGGGS